MRAIFSKDQYSSVIVVNTTTKEKLFNTLVLSPGTDPAALVAMKVYIDTVATEPDISQPDINVLIREYNRMKQLHDNNREFTAWEK